MASGREYRLQCAVGGREAERGGGDGVTHNTRHAAQDTQHTTHDNNTQHTHTNVLHKHTHGLLTFLPPNVCARACR